MKKRNTLMLLASLALFATSCTVTEVPADPKTDDSTTGGNGNTGGEANDKGGDEENKDTGPKEMSGSGTEDNPYVISNKSQLLDFASKGALEDYCTSYYTLTADIDASGTEWTPVGAYSETDDSVNPFSGVFSGNGHTISGLKITNFDSSNDYYGFFGMTLMPKITGLNLKDFTIDLDVKGKDSTIYVGGIFGCGYDSYVRYSSVEFTNFSITSTQTSSNDSSYLFVGGIGGQQVLYPYNNTGYYVDIRASYVKGDIKIDTSDASGLVTATGGILGESYNYQNYNVSSINNCYFNGDIDGGSYVGGITGYLSSYSSIVDSYAYGGSIKATDTSHAYVGGLAGFGNYETAILNSYAGYSTVSAPASKTNYKSYADAICGYQYPDLYAYDMNYRGVALYNNYAKKGIAISADYALSGSATEIDSVSASFFKDTLNYSSDYWNLDSSYPTLVSEEKEAASKTVTLNANYEGGVNQTVSVTGGSYSAELANATSVSLTRSGYSFYGYTYDQEGTVEYRWYVPVNNDMTLYAGFASLEKLKGTYSVVCSDGSTTIQSGDWKFDENYFYWFQTEGDYYQYEYTFNGTYIFIGDYVTPKSGDKGNGGGYEDEIFTLNADGTISAYEVQDDSYIYTATKSATDRTIPSVKGKKYLGDWKGIDVSLSIYEDCQVIASVTGSTAKKYGGVNETVSKVKITVFGVSDLGEFTYDETNDVLYSGTNFLARDSVSAIYKTSEVDLLIAVVGEKTYVVKDGVLGDSSLLTGTVADGNTISYNGTEYTISGTILTKVEKKEDTGDTKENTYVGTWTLKVGVNSGLKLVLNADGTGTYNGTSITYTVKDNVITFECADLTFTLTYDKDKQTLSGSYVDEYDEGSSISSTAYEASSSSSSSTDDKTISVATVSGTYTGKLASTDITIVLKSDGTGTLNNGDTTMTFSWTVNETTGKLTITNWSDPTEYFDDLSLTYDHENKTLNGTLVQDGEYELKISTTKNA